MFNDLLNFFDFFIRIISVFGEVWFIIFPIVFWFLFKNFWLRHAANCWMATQNDILLEIIPPQNIEKSPKVMEGFFNALAATDAGMNMFAKYALGKMNPYFSLEIVGTEGQAHFYVRTPAFFRSLVESALYAQYEGVEVIQVDDYTQNVPENIPNDEWTLWGSDWILLKEDAYPIKTYKYFDEDITGKMIDPLANYMEIISTLEPNQHIWLQYIIQAKRPGWFREWGMPTVDKFISEVSDKRKSGEEGNQSSLDSQLTPGERQTLTALEENITKAMFSVKVRLLYVGRKDNFNMVNVAGTSAMLKEFSDEYTNQFIPSDRSKTYADYVNVDARKAQRQRRILARYRDRDDSGLTVHFSSTELATLFHLPDMSIISPSVQFSERRLGGAPTNLPTGDF